MVLFLYTYLAYIPVTVPMLVQTLDLSKGWHGDIQASLKLTLRYLW